MNAKLKKALIPLTILLLVVSLSIAGTLAYLSSSKTTSNEFSFGQIKVVVKDDKAENSSIYLAPGDRLSREPYVQVAKKDSDFNEIVPSVLRVTITFSQATQDQQNLFRFITLENINPKWDFTRYEAGSPESVKGKYVGYYSGALSDYYDGTVTTENTTAPMFEAVHLHPETVGGTAEAKEPLLEGANSSFTMDVVVEAVQAEIDGKDYSDNPKKAFELVDAKHGN